MGEWNHGLFDCFSDMGTCCCGTFCSCCQLCQNAEDLGESGALCFLAACCLSPLVPAIILRMKAREKYNIDGSAVEDVGVACCCTCCASVQMANEVRSRGDHK